MTIIKKSINMLHHLKLKTIKEVQTTHDNKKQIKTKELMTDVCKHSRSHSSRDKCTLESMLRALKLFFFCRQPPHPLSLNQTHSLALLRLMISRMYVF